MNQLTFVEPGRLEWRDVAEPKLEGNGEAIVRPVAVATCDLDLMFVRGDDAAEAVASHGGKLVISR